MAVDSFSSQIPNGGNRPDQQNSAHRESRREVIDFDESMRSFNRKLDQWEEMMKRGRAQPPPSPTPMNTYGVGHQNPTCKLVNVSTHPMASQYSSNNNLGYSLHSSMAQFKDQNQYGSYGSVESYQQFGSYGLVGSCGQLGNYGSFGSSTFGSTLPFGTTSQPALGAASTPAFGPTPIPSFGASSTPAYGSTQSYGQFGNGLMGSGDQFRNCGLGGSYGHMYPGQMQLQGAVPFQQGYLQQQITPTFGYQQTIPTFGASPTFGSSTFGSTLQYIQTPLGAPSSSLFVSSNSSSGASTDIYAYGSNNMAFGAASNPSFDFGSSPSFGQPFSGVTSGQPAGKATYQTGYIDLQFKNAKTPSISGNVDAEQGLNSQEHISKQASAPSLEELSLAMPNMDVGTHEMKVEMPKTDVETLKMEVKITEKDHLEESETNNRIFSEGKTIENIVSSSEHDLSNVLESSTSLASAERMREVANPIRSFFDERSVIVLSTMGKTTNKLLPVGEIAVSCGVSDIADIDRISFIRDLHLETIRELGIDMSVVSGNLMPFDPGKENNSVNASSLAGFTANKEEHSMSSTGQYADKTDTSLMEKGTTLEALDIDEHAVGQFKKLEGNKLVSATKKENNPEAACQKCEPINTTVSNCLSCLEVELLQFASKLKDGERSAELNARVDQFILRRKNALLMNHLPPKIVQVVCCKLTSLQLELYNHFTHPKNVRRAITEEALLSAVVTENCLMGKVEWAVDNLKEREVTKKTQFPFDPGGIYDERGRFGVGLLE